MDAPNAPLDLCNVRSLGDGDAYVVTAGGSDVIVHRGDTMEPNARILAMIEAREFAGEITAFVMPPILAPMPPRDMRSRPNA